MAEQGYLIFTVDNRGSDNRGFEFESNIDCRCGFIEFEKKADAEKAIEAMNGKEIKGKALEVMEAVEKKR